MRTILVILFLILSCSFALGETYKWVDANGMHFTDNPESIPNKYREKVIGEARGGSPAPQSSARESLTSKNIHPRTISDYDTNRVINALQSPLNFLKTTSPPKNIEKTLQYPFDPLKTAYTPKSIEKALEPLSRFVAMVFLISALTFIVWLLILVDIIRSEFKDSSNKTLWIIMVILLPPLGVLLYLIIGLGQKKGGVSSNDKVRDELVARLHSDKSKDGKFVIR